MNLKATRTITYTPPISSQAGAIADQIAAIDSILVNMPDEDAERLREKRANLEAQLPDVTDYRITVETMDVKAEGRYWWYLRNSRSWIETAAGASYDEVIEEIQGAVLPWSETVHDYNRTLTLSRRWAKCMAATVKIETCTRKVTEDAGEFHDIGTWPAWREDPETWFTDVPANLQAVWEDQVEACNPGYWSIPDDDASKKSGRIIVS